MCNRSGHEIDRDWWEPWIDVTLYMSHDDVRKLDALILAGTGAAGVYWGAVKANIITGAAVSAPVAAIIGGIITMYIGWIKWSDSGCGVTLSTSVTPVTPVSAAAVWVESQ